MEDFLDIGAADTASGHFDENFTFSDFGNRNVFNAHDAFLAEDPGAHGFGDATDSARGFHNRTHRTHATGTFSRAADTMAMN